MPRSAPRRPADSEIVDPPQPRPRPDEDARARCSGKRHTARRVRGGQGRAGRPRAASSASQWRAPHFVWQVRNELGQILCPGQPVDACETIDTGGYRVTRRSTWTCRTIDREVGLRRGPRAEPEGTDTLLRQPQDPVIRLGLARATCAARTSTTARPPSIDYRTGEVLAYVGSAQLLRPGQREVPAPVRRPLRRLAPARVVDQADQLRDRHRRQDDDRGDDVHGRHHRLRRRLHADPGRRPRARPGPAPLRAPVLAQHPLDQGRRHQRPRPLLRAVQGLRHLSTSRAPCRSSRWASARSRSTRSTCSAATARSRTAAC